MGDIITIDGPASSGKSTIGLLFAQKIGYQFIDSGNYYRACAYYLINHTKDLNNEEQNAKLCEALNIKVNTSQDNQKVLLNGNDITPFLKTSEIDQASSIIATQAKVREVIKNIQRRSTLEGQYIVAGRDIGTIVFPDAHLKFFINAPAEVRAKRRYEQLTGMGAGVSLEKVLEEIKQRDYNDSTRKVSPLTIPKDAVVINTANLTVPQVVDSLYSRYCQNN